MTELANAEIGVADPDRMAAVDHDAREAAAATIEEGAVNAPHVFSNELPGLVAKDAQVLCRDIGIVDHDVVVIAAADPRLRPVNPKPAGDVALARQYLDPHHLTVCTASRKRLPSAIASS
jgi:hypothetical protein